MCQRLLNKLLTITYVLIFTSLLCLYTPIYAASATEKVRIGYFDGFGLVHDTEGLPKGYLSDLVSTLDRHSPASYELVPLVNNDIPTLLASGEIDIFALTVKTPQRVKTFAFSMKPFSITQTVLVADTERSVYRDDLSSMHGKSVAVLPGIGLEEHLYAWLQKHKIPMNVILPKSMQEFLDADADFHLTTVHYLPPKKKVVSVIQSMGLFFMSTPEHQNLLHTLQETLALVLEKDSTLLQRLHDRYILPLWQNSPFLTRQQTQLLRDVSDPRVPATLTAFAASHAPLQYVNSKGQADGITIDILKLLAKKYPSQAEYVPIELGSDTDVSGFDVLCTIVGNREEKEQFFFESDPYLRLPMELIQPKEVFAKGLYLLGMLDYSSLSLDQVRSFFPQWQLETFVSLSDMLNAYKEERIHGLLLSSVDAGHVMNIMGKQDNMRFQTPLVVPYTLYIAKKLHPESINITNAFIGTLDPLEVNTIVLNEIDAFRPASTFSELLVEHLTTLLSLVGIAIIAGIGLYLNINRLRKNELARVLHVDALTSLASERRFIDVAHALLARARPDEYVIASFDIDNFSTINQNFGYERGNELLIALAKHMQILLSSSLVLARQKDDVFLVLLRNYGTNSLVSHDDTCIQTLDREAKRVLGQAFSLSMSFGCYVIHDPKTPLDTMLDYCTVARQSGKATFGFITTFFTEEMQEQLRMHSFVLGQMKAGIDNNEFFLVFQPKVDLSTRKIVGAEALVRWSSEKGLVISPQHFIPIFEKNGFITQFDYYVFEMVCQYIHIHRKSVFVPPLAVNLSGHTVLQADTPNTLKRIMRHYEIAPAELEIEITESAIISECTHFIKRVHALKSMGFHIALDDFGTGVSSLNRLRSIPLDVVKLDKAFLDANIAEEGKGYTIVDSIVTMLQQLEIKVVAEGVETIEHMEWLTHIGCDVAQGYYFSKPVRGDIFYEMLKYPETFAQSIDSEQTTYYAGAPQRRKVLPPRAHVPAQGAAIVSF